MEIKTKETLRELFTTALCLDISISPRRQSPYRSRIKPDRLIDEYNSPPSKRVALSHSSLSSEILSPGSEQLLELFSPETQTKLRKDFIKDDKYIENILGRIELDDPNYVHFNSNPKIGTDLELWVCVNIKCPGCGDKLYKYFSTSMPAVDVRCNNPKHNLKYGPKYYQIKATELGKTYNGLKYFSLDDKDSRLNYICTGSYRFGYNCHIITSDSKDKDILIGYICLAYNKSASDENIILDNANSFILKPNLSFIPKTDEQKLWTYYSYLDKAKPRITFHREMFEIIRLPSVSISLNTIYDADKLQTEEPPANPIFIKYLIMKMKYLNLKKKFYIT